MQDMLCTVTALGALGGVSGSRLGCPLAWHASCLALGMALGMQHLRLLAAPTA